MFSRATALSVLLMSGACSVPDLELEGLACPCIEGWRCDRRRQICVEGAADAGVRRDGATPDTTRPDAPLPDVPVDTPQTPDAQLDGPTPESGPDVQMPTDAGPDAPTPDGGPDVPTPDAGPDAGPDAATPGRCDVLNARADVYRCDSFERAALDYPINTSGGSVDIVSTGEAHSGTRAARVTAPTSGSRSAMLISEFPNNMIGERWFRAWYYVPRESDFFIEPILIESATGVEQIAFYTEGPSYSEFHAHNIAMPDPLVSAAGRFEFDTWVCVEVHIDYSGPVFEVYLDGLLSAQIAASTPQPLTTAVVGLPYVDPTSPRGIIYVDDVVLSSARVGCSP